MSDPVTNAQIEDVLSSIRRLVSEDTRQNFRPDRSKSPTREAGTASGKLVLTPALRVAEPVVSASAAPEIKTAERDDGVQAENEIEAIIDVELEDEELLAEIIDITSEVEDDPVTEAGEIEADFDFEQPEVDDFVPDIEDVAVDSEPVFDEAEDASAPWRDPEATLFEAAGVASSADDGISTETEGARRSLVDDALSRKVAALEQMIARQDDTWEPDGIQDDDYSGTEVETLSWEDLEPERDELLETPSTRPEAKEPISEARKDEDQPSRLELTSADDAVLDEAALRELVADIVREELQGALGERITRNVRKLVRREIHRALSIQDLE